MRQSNQQPKMKTANKVLWWVGLSLLILLALGGVFYGTYQWQHSMVTTSERQVAQLTTQLKDAQAQVANGQNKNESTYVSSKGVLIKVYVPASGTTLRNPLIVLGEVPGNWSFEASFPAILKDAKGSIVAQTPAQVIGAWTTSDLVPFSLKLPYVPPSSGDGSLVLQKDNPSGLAANDDSVSIPIKFE